MCWTGTRARGRGIREVVIHLAVDYNVIIARSTGRRECPRCGTLYNVAFHPPQVEELCDLDGEVVEVDASNDPPELVYQKIGQAIETDDRSQNRR